MNQIVDYLLVLAVYALGIALFQVLGGLSAAAEALKRSGEASSTPTSKSASKGTP